MIISYELSFDSPARRCYINKAVPVYELVYAVALGDDLTFHYGRNFPTVSEAARRVMRMAMWSQWRTVGLGR